MNDGATKAYGGGFAVSANGRTTIDYRATDKAGNRESWQHLSFRIDSRAPSIAVGMSGTAGDATATWRGPVTLKPTFTDATSGVAGKLVAIDGKEAKALTTGSVVIEKDGNHVVAFTATDAAGNQATTSRAFRIDTVAPVVTTPLVAGKPPTVTPNGDGSTETVAIPFTVSEPSTVTATIAGPDGAPVRTLTTVASTAGTLAWDGRTSRGKAVPDGRYTVTLKARDTVGNTGSADPVAVDVYAALAGLARSTALFYPQDGDTLAAKASISFRLQSPAQVTVRVLDASGAVVRTAFADKALAAGPVTWTWNGKIAGGSVCQARDVPDRGRRDQREPGRRAVGLPAGRRLPPRGRRDRRRSGAPPSPSPPGRPSPWARCPWWSCGRRASRPGRSRWRRRPDRPGARRSRPGARATPARWGSP